MKSRAASPAPIRLNPMTYRDGRKGGKDQWEAIEEAISSWKKRADSWIQSQSQAIQDIQSAEYSTGRAQQPVAEETALLAAAKAFLEDPTLERLGVFRTAGERASVKRSHSFIHALTQTHIPKRYDLVLEPFPEFPAEATLDGLTWPGEKQRLTIASSALLGGIIQNWLLAGQYRPSGVRVAWTSSAEGEKIPAGTQGETDPKGLTSVKSRWESWAQQQMTAQISRLGGTLEQAMLQWFQEARTGEWELTPMTQLVAQLGVQHREAKQGWFGQPASCGPLDLSLSRTRQWLKTAPALDKSTIEAGSGGQVFGPVESAFWESYPPLADPATVLDRLRRMTRSQMGGLFKNPGLGAEGLRLIRNWAVFHLLQIGGSNRFLISGDLPAEVLNRLAESGHPLNPEEMERLEHACRFSTSPDLRAKLCLVGQVANAPWAEVGLFRKPGKGSAWSEDLIMKAVPVLHPETASALILRSLVKSQGGEGLPNWPWKKILEAVPAERFSQWDRGLVGRFLKSADRGIREIAIRKVGEGMALLGATAQEMDLVEGESRGEELPLSQAGTARLP